MEEYVIQVLLYGTIVVIITLSTTRRCHRPLVEEEGWIIYVLFI